MPTDDRTTGTASATCDSRKPGIAFLLMLAAIGAAYMLTVLLAPGVALVILLLPLVLRLIVRSVRGTVALHPENER